MLDKSKVKLKVDYPNKLYLNYITQIKDFHLLLLIYSIRNHENTNEPEIQQNFIRLGLFQNLIIKAFTSVWFT